MGRRGTVHVLGGAAKGRELSVPPSPATRPPLALLRKSWFDRMGDLSEAAVLDLCAGSGCLGIEALSRGAGFVRLVESDRAACRSIRENLAATRLSGGEVVCAPAFRGDAIVPPSGRAWVHVLFDPPFAWSRSDGGRRMLADVLRRLAGDGVLAPDGSVWMRLDRRAEAWPASHGLRFVDARVHGDSLLILLRGRS